MKGKGEGNEGKKTKAGKGRGGKGERKGNGRKKGDEKEGEVKGEMVSHFLVQSDANVSQ